MSPLPEKTVTLNISGYKATIAISALTGSFGGKYFESMFASGLPTACDAGGNVYIERQSSAVPAIIYFMSTGELPAGLSDTQLVDLRRDMDFFGIDALAEVLAEYKDNELARLHPHDVEVLTKALEHSPDSLPLQVALGTELFRQKKWPEAFPHLLSAVQAQPSDYSLAKLFIETCVYIPEKIPVAYQLAKDWTTFEPENFDAKVLFIKISFDRSFSPHFFEGDYYPDLSPLERGRKARQEAEQLISELIIENPKSSQLHETRAAIRLSHKDFVGALDDASYALDLSPYSNQAYSYLGLAALHLDDFKGAERALQMANRLNPCEQNYFHMGLFYARSSQWKHVEEIFRNLYKNNPKYTLVSGNNTQEQQARKNDILKIIAWIKVGFLRKLLMQS